MQFLLSQLHEENYPNYYTQKAFEDLLPSNIRHPAQYGRFLQSS